MALIGVLVSKLRSSNSVFEVRCYYPFDDEWEGRQKAVFEAAGRGSDFSGMNLVCEGRDHGWIVGTFEDAVAMKNRLNEVPMVNTTVQEQ